MADCTDMLSPLSRSQDNPQDLKHSEQREICMHTQRDKSDPKSAHMDMISGLEPLRLSRCGTSNKSVEKCGLYDSLKHSRQWVI